MTACAACGAAIKPEARFCTGCGATVPPPKPTCAACGNEMREGAKFCTSCGATIGEPGAVPTAPAAATPVAAGGPATAAAGSPAAEQPSLVAKAVSMLGLGGLLMIGAGILMIVAVTKPWFTMPELGELAYNEGWVMSTGYEVFEPSSPIQADIGYLAVIMGAASVILGLLNIFDVAPEMGNAIDRAWKRVFGNYFMDGGVCLLVLAAVILRFVTRQDGTEYASGIYLFLVAAIMLTVGSVVAKAQATARAQTVLATQDES